MGAVLVFLISLVGLVIALVGALAGLVWIATAERDLISDDLGATLGVVSIIDALGAVPVGIIGWRWAARRGEGPRVGQAAALIGGTTLFAWFALIFYALSQDTP